MKNILFLCFTLLFLNSSPLKDFNHSENYKNESMHYLVRYGPFTIGKAEISMRNDTIQGIYHIKAVAHSTGLVKIVKRLNYIYESHMDPVTGLPIDFIMDVKDNRAYFYNKMIFDRESRKDSAIVHSHLSGAHVVSKDIHDVLTGFIHFRDNCLSDLKEDDSVITINTYFVDKLWDLRIRYAGKEKINTKFGKVNCLKFKPSTVVGNFFKNDDDMTMWISDDANHIPLRIKLNLTIGAIDGYLVDYRGSRAGI